MVNSYIKKSGVISTAIILNITAVATPSWINIDGKDSDIPYTQGLFWARYGRTIGPLVLGKVCAYETSVMGLDFSQTQFFVRLTIA